jgi:tetratricopeptide (TPR) repeat protein
VPTEAVEALLTPAWDRDQVRQSLKNLAGVRLVRRQDQLYFLPPADAAIVLELIGEADRLPLLLKVVNTLAQHRVAEPRTVDDLRYHLAELRALLDRRSYGSAHDLLREIDREYLREWNSSRLLLRQRHELRRNLGKPRLERANENAIGGICTDLGDLVAARAAYDRALRLAGPDTKLAELARLHVNIGVMHWAANDIESARESFQQAEREADEADDLIARIGALGGLADCHRRRGEFVEAIARAAKGFALSRTEAFDALAEARTEGTRLAVALAVKLSRWQAELGATEQAEKWLAHARRAAERDPERAERYQAVLEDQLADLQLAKGLGNGKVKRAVATAREAARLAQQMHDSTVLLQARITLCVAYLRAGRKTEAAAEIARAARYRPPGRHLVVPALLALTVRLTGDRDEARRRFGELLAEADRRIARDAPPGNDLGPGDFGARRWQGFARCGLALDGRCEVAAAVASFRMIDIPNPPRPPGLVARMRLLLECLDASGDRPGLLGPAIDALG